MRRIVAVLALAAVLTTAALIARGANSADRPSGVSAVNWIALSDGFGFVIVPTNSEPVALPQGALLLRPAISGYFMVKQPGGWGRVVVIDPPKGSADAG